MVQSIIVYTVLFIIMFLFAKSSAYRQKYSFSMGISHPNKSIFSFNTILPIILFAVVFGMRYDVGTDHLTYLYKYVNQITTERYEPFYQLITDVCHYFDIHFAIYFGLLAFIQILFFYLAFNNERAIFPFILFFFITVEDWMPWMNIIRQSLAMCIWLYSLKYIENKQFWRYLLFVLIAFCFHRSAIILIVFYPILQKEKIYFKSVLLQLALLGLAFICNKLFGSVVNQLESVVSLYSSILGSDDYAESYNSDKLMENFSANEGTGLAFLFKLLINIIIIIFSPQLRQYYNNKRFNIIYFFFFVGVITLYIFPPGAISISRPFRFFYIFHMIMYGYFSYFLYNTSTEKGRLELFYFIIFSFLGMFYLSQITASEYSHKWYQFYFQINDRQLQY